MPRIAKVRVDLSLDREFDYRVPAALEGVACVGARVEVPFGRRTLAGYIVALTGASSRGDLKDILSVKGERPMVGETILALARWMAEYYCCAVEQAIRAVLPGAVRRREAKFKTRLFVSLAEPAPPATPPAPSSAATGGRAAAKPLPAKQALVLEALRVTGVKPLAELMARLGVTAAPVHALVGKGLVRLAEEAVARDPRANRTILRTGPLDLMPEQAEALRVITAVVDRCATTEPAAAPPARHVVLLYGVTGSGKTEVYLQAISHARRMGRGAIVLVPEISLTPQTVERFAARFGDEVAVLHSRLSDGERHDEWHRIQAGQAPIVVGARSAVFAPVPRLGIVIVDEEHEPSYKQDEAPRYHARDVAVMRGHLERCAVVLGSATPSLESWMNARNGKYELARLPRRVDDRKMPVMRVVDMRVETQAQGKVSLLSKPLREAIRARLDKAQQVILFLNRRGFASSLTCPKCGFVAQCDSCSVAFTYHRQDERLLCHICGAARPVPPNCPKCGDAAFRFAGAGTQRVEAVVAKCFPHAKVQRMDADTTGRRHAHEDILGQFRLGKTDILIGTQMIAKGLHFPNVTLVGIIHADMGLNLPDFRAGERSFQLFAQVAGRAGRGEVPGEVIVQTFTPFHNAIQAARRLDFERFCDQETEFRRELGYPPFGRLTCVTFKGRSESRVSFLATAFGDKLRSLVSERVTVAAACPAPLAKAKDHYRFQVIARGPTARELAGPLRETMRQMPMPPDVTCTVDVDAVDLL